MTIPSEYVMSDEAIKYIAKLTSKDFDLMNSRITLEFLKKCTHTETDKELVEKVIELTNRDASLKLTLVEEDGYVAFGKCICGSHHFTYYKFCPDCGQRMEERDTIDDGCTEMAMTKVE